MADLCYRWAPIVLAALAVAGCAPMQPPVARSPLTSPQMSPDSVVLDIFFVRFPYGLEEANGPLWQEVDEQHFPADSRRRLAENGFRAGLVSDQMPATLCRLLELNDQPSLEGHSEEVVVTDLEKEPRVVRRHLQLRAQQRSEITASDIYDELPVLLREPDGVCGRSYPKAQGILVLKSFPQRDGRVRLDIEPELQYGDTKQRYTGTYGMFRLEQGRSQKSFDSLALSATLAPGNMVVMSSLPARAGSLGHSFFTHTMGGKTEQKLLVIRLSQTQQDPLFAPEPQPVDLKPKVEKTARPSVRQPKAKTAPK